MNGQPSPDAGSVQRLESRARALALEKSYLELVVRLMARVGAASGVQNVADMLLRNILDVIGGTDIVLYYRMDDAVHAVDVYGAHRTMPEVEDLLVRRVFETKAPVEHEGDFADTRLRTAAFTKAYTWVYPLLAGAEVVGVLKMENLHIGMRDLYAHLPVFFNYAAQVLRNEVRNDGRLQQAYDDLRVANAALLEEAAEREQAAAALQRANATLEERVAARTRQIQETNVRLQQELAERLRAEGELTRRNRELACLNRFLRALAADPSPQEVLDLACRELAEALDLPHGLAWLLPDGSGERTLASAGGGDDRAAEAAAAWEPRGFVRHLAAQGLPLVVESVETDARGQEIAIHFPGLQFASLVAVPLSVNAEPAGCLVLASAEPRSFTGAEVSLASRVGEQVSAALARHRAQADSRRLRVAIEQGPDSVVITDERGEILYVNPAFTAASGYTRGEVVGRNPRQFKSGQHDRTFYEGMWSTLTSGRTWHGRITNRRKSGELFTEDAIIVPVRDTRGRVMNYIALKRDITRELAREDQLRHVQRMEGIGQLAGGVAHDFNNILGVILMQLEMMQVAHELPQEVTDGIEVVRKAADRAATLTRQLLTFSRRQTISLHTEDLNAVVGHITAMLGRVLPESITQAYVPSGTPLPFSGDAAMIEQVVMNLCVNARDAMPAGGRLTVSTGEIEFAPAAVPPNPDARAGRFVYLRVADTGCGMPSEVMSHLFEPFYTTKDVGRGTGLGLATSYGIATQHRGWIDVESEPGRGSTFTVYLPMSAEAIRSRPAGRGRPEGGEAAVLLVEDEEAIRRMTQRCLQQLGYRVVVAANGAEALAAWDAEQGRFDLLLTDVVMPMGLSGVELSRQLRARKGDLRVILMSGYPADIAREGGTIGADVTYLAKPFTLRQLGTFVKRALAAPLPPNVP